MLQILYEIQNMANFIYFFNKLHLVNMEEEISFINFVKNIRELVNQLVVIKQVIQESVIVDIVFKTLPSSYQSLI
jgi:hypothetical protein